MFARLSFRALMLRAGRHIGGAGDRLTWSNVWEKDKKHGTSFSNT